MGLRKFFYRNDLPSNGPSVVFDDPDDEHVKALLMQLPAIMDFYTATAMTNMSGMTFSVMPMGSVMTAAMSGWHTTFHRGPRTNHEDHKPKLRIYGI